MKFKNKNKNQEFQELLDNLNENNNAFYKVQDHLVEIRNNIERNQKMIEALQAENENIQSELDSLQVSETGEINLDGFDELSNKISSNNRKISVIQKVIDNFANKMEYQILTEYSSLQERSIQLRRKCFTFLCDQLLNEFLESSAIRELNIIYNLSLNSEDISYSKAHTQHAKKEVFLNNLFSLILNKINNDDGITDTKIPPLNIEFPYVDSKVIVTSYQRIEELKKKLNQ
ncbi:hypothetical protein ACFGW3_04815 [Pasteurella multocida]